MQINNLQRKTGLKKKRYVGRGGKRGTTAGRGTKGQKARAGHRIRPEIRDLIKKLPKQRGRGKNSNKSIHDKPVVISLDVIEQRSLEGMINPKTLVTDGAVSRRAGRIPAIKLLAGRKNFTKKITVEGCEVSASARAQIERVGGTIK
ncbi:MAG TPA: uL15 family ribosomal protein [Candidatus Paceibacterota bacterium]|nr:uL15 family ribosomal protein [Candidatus Paceibacterota bacterium]